MNLLYVAGPALSVSTRPAAVAPSLGSGAVLPKLVVFDLDNTLWLPELYQHNKKHKGRPPVAGEDVCASEEIILGLHRTPLTDSSCNSRIQVKLLPGAVAALHELLTCEEWRECEIAVASRTNQGDWARALLAAFRAPGDESRSLADAISYEEIYVGTKIPHFESLRARSGRAYSEMLFFDDSRGGRYGNVEPVAALGVCAAHCPEVQASITNPRTQLAWTVSCRWGLPHHPWAT